MFPTTMAVHAAMPRLFSFDLRCLAICASNSSGPRIVIHFGPSMRLSREQCRPCGIEGNCPNNARVAAVAKSASKDTLRLSERFVSQYRTSNVNDFQ